MMSACALHKVYVGRSSDRCVFSTADAPSRPVAADLFLVDVAAEAEADTEDLHLEEIHSGFSRNRTQQASSGS